MDLEKLFGSQFLTNSENLTAKDVFDGKLVALYFSGHWCPPCKAFTPKLVEVYKAVNTPKKRLEVLFVSFDRNEDEMLEYLDEMPFAALPYADSHRREYLGMKYQSMGIPMLVVLRADGSVASINGRAELLSMREGVIDYWERLARGGALEASEEQLPKAIRRFRILPK